MKRSTSRWTTAMTAAALIALPAAGYAQAPAGQQPPPQNPTQSTAPKTPQMGAESPAEHVRVAKQALSSIQANTLPASARPKFQQLRTHLNNLERDVAKGESASSGASPSAKSGKSNWGTEVAAIDKILTELIGPDTGSAASAGSMTSGTAGGATGTAGKSPATIDEATKEQLRTVRQHVTALATSMSGTPKTEPSPSAAAPSPSEPPSATPSAAAPSTTAPTATPSAPSAAPTAPSTTPSPEPSATPTPSANQQTTPAGAQPPAAQGQVDREAAKRHLSEARESLSQIASMPEAAKLQGEQRNQVSQLIANFNELITTQADWKAAYAKLDGTLSALLGPSNATPSPAGTTGTTGAPAAAGTSGSAALEPAIRAKLEEFRTHMKEFEQAAGGGQTASNSPSMSPSVSTGSTSSPAAPSPSQPTPSPTTPPASPTPTEPTPSPAAPSNPTPNPTPSATPAPTGTTGSAGVAGATGTTGAASPAATDAAASSSEANRHLDAIADILSKAKDGKLDKEQTEQIKIHLDQLRQLLKT